MGDRLPEFTIKTHEPIAGLIFMQLIPTFNVALFWVYLWLINKIKIANKFTKKQI